MSVASRRKGGLYPSFETCCDKQEHGFLLNFTYQVTAFRFADDKINDMKKGDYNEIVITKSKIKVYNPGGILNNVSPVDFANGRIGSKIRNPLIATVSFKNGLIDAFGTGFERTFKVCAENDVDYEYENDEFGFSFMFKRKGEQSPSDKIKPLDDEIMEMLKENPHRTIPEMAEKVHKSPITIHRHLDSLSCAGNIERVGSRKAGYWNVFK